MSSIQLLTRPFNQIEQTKTIGIEEKRMLFERVQLDWVIERSGTLYKKTRMEQNRSIDPALKQPRRFFSFITVFPYSESSCDNMLSALILKYYFPIIPCHFPVSRHENFPDYFLSLFLCFLKNLL